MLGVIISEGTTCTQRSFAGVLALRRAAGVYTRSMVLPCALCMSSRTSARIPFLAPACLLGESPWTVGWRISSETIKAFSSKFLLDFSTRCHSKAPYPRLLSAAAARGTLCPLFHPHIYWELLFSQGLILPPVCTVFMHVPWHCSSLERYLEEPHQLLSVCTTNWEIRVKWGSNCPHPTDHNVLL